MAKENAKTAPEMAKLPMGSGEDQPVIIDLPDGQKLVVGNLAHGSVIEVATWRGTGRPDSRTSRLMLGMSSATAAEQANSESKNSKKKSDDEKPSLIELLIVGSKKIIAITAGSLAKIKKAKPAKLKIDSESEQNSESSESSKPLVTVLQKAEPIRSASDLEVDEWLNNLIKKTEAKAAKASAKTTVTKKTATKNNVRKATPKKSGKR